MPQPTYEEIEGRNFPPKVTCSSVYSTHPSANTSPRALPNSEKSCSITREPEDILKAQEPEFLEKAIQYCES